jgi:hemolysin D
LVLSMLAKRWRSRLMLSISIDTVLSNGKVVSLSPDAITREKQSGKYENTRQTPEEDTSEPNDQELAYAARISLERSQMQVEDKLVDLAPGMAVTVEIKTGSRRIIIVTSCRRF